MNARELETPADNEKAQFEKPTFGSIHFEYLHDEDSDRAGQKVNEATGELIVKGNTQDVGHEILHEIDLENADEKTDDIMGKVNDGTDDDEAARWLRAHGGK